MLSSNPQSIQNAEEALKNSSEVALLTLGISMRPMLREHRDVVVIERVNRKLKKHDVPLYRREGCDRFVLHRIIKVTDNGYVIRGDNLYRNEYNVTDKDIIGVLKCFYRDGKYYDCEKSLKYKCYIVFNRLSFPFRYIWVFVIRRALSKIKRIIFK